MAFVGSRRGGSGFVSRSGLAAGIDAGSVCAAGGVAMKLLAILCAVTLSCAAQKIPGRGEQVFAKTCATGYCHGPKGGASGAPRLAGRGFTRAYINGVVMRGVPGTGMASFSATLSKVDLAEVVGYVAALNGVSSRDVGEAPSSKPALTGEAAHGAKLFTEATR